MSLDENEEAHLPSRQAVVRRIEKLWESKGVGAPLVEPTGETFLDRYRIIEFLGAGAFGVVYRVLDLTMEREVALKLPRAEVQVEEELQKRFANEVRLAAKLEHPGIVKLYEAKLEPPICFFTSEFCEGSDLAKWMRQRSEGGQRCADWQNVVRFIAKVAEATDYAHQQGVYHRDLKPANILLAPRESPVEEAETCLDHFDSWYATLHGTRAVS